MTAGEWKGASGREQGDPCHTASRVTGNIAAEKGPSAVTRCTLRSHEAFFTVKLALGDNRPIASVCDNKSGTFSSSQVGL
ncbi:hypothetical protein NCHU2750_01710 [Neorhizobium sp. NCHU2750]|nr:hypothetical protein NCHU2750_01710 [Neorhizobium sp. NCHU2750]